MSKCRLILFFSFSISIVYSSSAQTKANDVTTPLHLLKPDYKVPYGAPSADSVKKVLDKVLITSIQLHHHSLLIGVPEIFSPIQHM
jgi:hypothetical protein